MLRTSLACIFLYGLFTSSYSSLFDFDGDTLLDDVLDDAGLTDLDQQLEQIDPNHGVIVPYEPADSQAHAATDPNHGFIVPYEPNDLLAHALTEFGPIIDTPEVLHLVHQDLLEASFDGDGRSTGLIPENPVGNAEEFDVECVYGNGPYGPFVPDQSEFPVDPTNPYYSLDYPTVYDLCSFFTKNGARHLAFTCRNPNLGDWPFGHDPPRADRGLAAMPRLVELCYKSCRCRKKRPGPKKTPKDGDILFVGSSYVLVWKNGAVVFQDSPGSTFLPNVDSFSSFSGSDSPSYTICKLSAGSDSRCKSYKSPIRCKGSCPNPDLSSDALDRSHKVPSISDIYADQQRVCHTKCDPSNHFRCGNRKAKCRCLASKVTGSLANLAGCATLGTIKALLAKQAVSGSRLGGRGLDPRLDIRFGCVCNGSYASAACCEAEDGIVNEHGQGLGQLEL